MEIRPATISDAEQIKEVYLQAFDSSEAEKVSELAISLLEQEQSVKTISLVACMADDIIGHIAFSPVYLESTDSPSAYILAPLAVLPSQQKNKVGTGLIEKGLKLVEKKNTAIVFVYGDPAYYSRFGFSVEQAKAFIPPYPLKYPSGWQAIMLTDSALEGEGRVKCVSALDDPDLW